MITARDVLSDPVKRFAYDRLGPYIVTYQNCTTVPDYLKIGALEIAVWYIGMGGLLIVASMFGALSNGPQFWRFLMFGMMMILEAWIMTFPRIPIVLGTMNKLVTKLRLRYTIVQFQLIFLVRRVSMAAFNVMYELSLLLAELIVGSNVDNSNDELMMNPVLLSQRIVQLLGGLTFEVTNLVRSDISPFTGHRKDSPLMCEQFKTVLVENFVRDAVRSDPRVVNALQDIIDEKKKKILNDIVEEA